MIVVVFFFIAVVPNMMKTSDYGNASSFSFQPHNLTVEQTSYG